MAKKHKKQKLWVLLNRRYNLPIYLAAAVIVLAALLFVQTLLPNSPYLRLLMAQTPSPVPILVAEPVASLSATHTPLATPHESTNAAIPVNFGRSVRVPILTYHYIGLNPNPTDKLRDNLSVSPEKFDEQLGYLAKNGYNAISLDTLYAALKGGQLPSKPVVLTFDDGYIDFYLNAFPIIKKYGLRVTSFIPTGLMNQGYYLTWEEIKEMDASGLVSFQAHTVSHANLASIGGEALKYQLRESKRVLEERLGKKVNFMAYPYGGSNEQTWQAVKEAGYLGAVGSWYGVIESEGTVYDWPREKIGGGFSLTDVIARL